MEDIKRKLEVPNRVIQFQALDKLVSEVRKKATTTIGGELLSSTTLETNESRLLWQCTGYQDMVVSRQAANMWIKLLTENLVEFSYVLNGFLNQVPTAKNLVGIIHGVGDLLSMQVRIKYQLAETYSCPYTIRSPPHPFITVVTNRPEESWPLLVQYVHRLFNHPNVSVQRSVFEMLGPFLQFMLLDPKCSVQNARARRSLMTALLECIQLTTDEAVKERGFEYMAGILRCMQDSTHEQLMEASYLCVQLMGCYGNSASDLDIAQTVATHSLVLCQKSQKLCLDYYSILQALLNFIDQHPQVMSREENYGILGEMMLSASPDDVFHLLTLAKVMLQTERESGSRRQCECFISMATINVLGLPGDVVMTTPHKVMTSLACEVMQLLQTHMSPHDENSEQTQTSASDTSSSGEEAQYISRTGLWTRLFRTLVKQPTALKQWLHLLGSKISHMSSVPVSLTNLLVSIILSHDDTVIVQLAIDRLSDLVKKDYSQALFILPVYLYVLGKQTSPEIRLHVLHSIPKLATHKYNVLPVLKTIQGLGQSPKLKSLSIRLLTQLWSLQDRCFLNLLKVISEVKVISEKQEGDVTMTTVVDDITLAKAQAIREVCRLRPEQHGADMLGMLSQILSSCTDARSVPAAAMCLQALYFICQAEVIDIMSAWKVLESQLVKETRSLIVVKICELLSLVPALSVKTEQYQSFLGEMTRLLWTYTQTSDETVVSAAYSALSHYSVNCFRVSHFKYQLVEEYVLQARAILEQGTGNPDDTIDTVMPFVPGVCYIRLLQTLSSKNDGYCELLSALVAEEVGALPRGIYYTSLRQASNTTNKNKAVAGIPAFLHTQYERTKQPGLRPSLAAAMLTCYDPPVEVGRDGRPRRHYAMSHGKNYQQMLASLLHDVQIQPSDWHRTTRLVNAWFAFSERLFASMLQARKAEIEVQLSRDFIDDDEADHKKTTAWLWVRDTVTDSIKKATRGNPTVQFNAILCLGGLASATRRYMASLSQEDMKLANEVKEHSRHSHWLNLVIDSAMSLVDFRYKPKVGLLGLCQQRTVDDRLPASVLAQAAAVLTLCQLTAAIMVNDMDLIYKMVGMLTERLPGQPTDEDIPPVLHLFHGYGLGVMLSKLVQENFTDIAGQKGSLTVMKALDALESCCLSSIEYTTGAMLGVKESLMAMCEEGRVESRAHVTSVHEKLVQQLKNTTPAHSTYPVLCAVVAMVTYQAFRTNVIEVETTDKVVLLLKSSAQTNTECTGLKIALGSLSHALFEAEHPTIGGLMATLQSDWLKQAGNIEGSLQERIAAFSGLAALGGSEHMLKDTEIAASKTSADVVVKFAMSQLNPDEKSVASDTVAMQSASAWLLGNLYASWSNTGRSSTSHAVPSNYGYLQESSVLRAIIDFLITAAKKGPEAVSSQHVEMCVKSLQEKVTEPLPPLNWMSLLTPLLKLPFGDEVRHGCISLALKLCTVSTSAALFVSSWIVPPLYLTLPDGCRETILRSAGSFVKTVTPSTLQNFLDKSCLPIFGGENTKGKSLQCAVLKGLNSALQVPDPPDSVSAILFKAVRELYGALKHELQPSVLNLLAQCVHRLPEAEFDRLMSDDCVCPDSVYQGTYVRAYLVAHGFQPLAILNTCIDAAFNTDCDHERLVNVLLECFHTMTLKERSRSPILQQLQWLLELMGHCHNIATQTYALKPEHAGLNKVVRFAMNIFAAAVCMWTCKTSAATFGMITNPFSGPDSLKAGKDITSDWSKGDHMTEDLSADWLTGDHMTGCEASDWSVSLSPVSSLPYFVSMLRVEPWVQILPKVLDWLMNMHDIAEDVLPQDVSRHLSDCLQRLRDSPDYAKISVWTKAVHIIHCVQ